MQEIVDRYNIPESPYLLPIIVKSGVDERKQYINASHRINRHLKTIGKELGLSVPLTHYVARHSWASAARSKNIPISVKLVKVWGMTRKPLQGSIWPHWTLPL